LKIHVSLQRLVFLGLVVGLLAALLAFGCGETKPSSTGGILKVGINADSTAIGYPPRMRSPSEVIMNRTDLETLGKFDAKGNIVPWLASEYKPDPKNATLTIVLKKNIKFHDGTVFDAKACKWNLDNYIASKSGELNIASIDVIDDYTVRLNLNGWDSDAIMKVSYYAGPMISPTAFQNAGTTDQARIDWAIKNPVGTGPFQFVSWTRDTKQVFKKNPNYWQPGKPYLDGVEWVIIGDPVTQASALKAGEIDAIKGVVFSSVKDLANSGFGVTPVQTGFGTMLISFIPDSGHADSPWSNLKVRQAAQYSIDSKAMLDAIYFGFGVPSNQWSAPDLYSYNPSVKGYPYDPNKAKQLLTEAGYSNGLKTNIICQTVAEGVQVSTALQGYFKAVGIDAQIDQQQTAKFTASYQVDGWTNATMNRSPRGWDVITQMLRYIHSSRTTYPAHKKVILKVDKIDKLIEEAMNAPDAATQKTKVWDLQKAVIDEYCLVTIVGVQRPVAVESKKVHNTGFNTVHVDQWTPEDCWLSK
jgi:peptide/nickel transport system substrate-binding protein